MERIFIRSKGGKHGEKIIKYLLSIGGTNPCRLDGGKEGWYYILNEKGNIDELKFQPRDYKEIKILWKENK